jgi:hypothetical protein
MQCNPFLSKTQNILKLYWGNNSYSIIYTKSQLMHRVENKYICMCTFRVEKKYVWNLFNMHQIKVSAEQSHHLVFQSIFSMFFKEEKQYPSFQQKK